MDSENINKNIITTEKVDPKSGESEKKESEDEKTKLNDKDKEKIDKKSSFVKFITCNNCFRGFGDKKTAEMEIKNDDSIQNE